MGNTDCFFVDDSYSQDIFGDFSQNGDLFVGFVFNNNGVPYLVIR